MQLEPILSSKSLQIILTDVCLTTERTTTLNEPVDASILTSMRTGAPQQLTGVPRRPAQQNDAIPRVPPKWLKHDRHVSLDRRDIEMTTGEGFFFQVLR